MSGVDGVLNITQADFLQPVTVSVLSVFYSLEAYFGMRRSVVSI
jgi:hypothetical protein